MNALTNDLLSKLESPIHSFYPRHITLLLNNDGDILDISKESSTQSQSIISQLWKQGNIKPLFDISPAMPLSSIAKKNSIVQGYADKINIEETLDPFYSVLPIASLKINKVAHNRFVGIITLSGIIPNVFGKATGSVVYIDNKDRVVGFNQTFFNHFKGALKKPGALLNHAARQFLSPSPMEIQKTYLKKVKINKEKDLNPIFTCSLPEDCLEKKEVLFSGREMSKKKSGLLWTSSQTESSHLTLLKAVHLIQDDIMVQLKVDSASGQNPFIVFGDADDTGKGLDHNGYLLGIEYHRNKIILKKRGFIVAAKDYTPGSKPRHHTYQVFKIGKAFIVFSNGKTIFEYYDYDFLERGKTFVSLFLRQNMQCLLQHIAFYTAAPQNIPADPNIIVKAKNRGNHFFLLNRFHSIFLSAFFNDISGYMLQDVSYLQNRLKNLEVNFQKQLNEGGRLAHLLEKYKKQQDGFIGSSKTMADIKEGARRIAKSASTILIDGPTGTGKEVLARYIHNNSSCKKGPFIKVDCATLPKSLMESELFGYEKGAFTGAFQRKTGLFELANNGTLFLDEVNNLTIEIQVKLLQFVQDLSFVRVGGSIPIKLNVRIIVASSVSLKKMVLKGHFREDLYYRIAVVPVSLPPLKERKEDLAELSQYFLDIYNHANHKNIQRISPAAFQKMVNYDWPGNIRELKNAMERAVIFCDGHEINSDLILLPTREITSTDQSAPESQAYNLVNYTKVEIIEMLKRHHGIIKRVAAGLGVTPRALYYHFKKLNIHPNRYRKFPRKELLQ